MTTSRNFDPVAHIYDETRHLPDAVRDAGLPALLNMLPSDARILDAGTGTGRIAVPLLERGADVFGVDISARMMARQRAKYPAARLTQGSATELPFGSGRFDAVLTAHVLHLIPDWRDALAEFKRVLRPGGLYLNLRSESRSASAWEDSNRFWRDWLMAHGGLPQGEYRGTWDQAEIETALMDMGALVSVIDTVLYVSSYTLRERVEGIRTRSQSSTWDIPDDLLAASADALEAFVTERYGGLDVEQSDSVVFQIYRAQFV